MTHAEIVIPAASLAIAKTAVTNAAAALNTAVDAYATAPYNQATLNGISSAEAALEAAVIALRLAADKAREAIAAPLP